MASRPTSTSTPAVNRELLERNPQLRLSDPEMKPTLDAFRARIRKDPAYGRHLLQESGIVDAKGKLTKPFGG